MSSFITPSAAYTTGVPIGQYQAWGNNDATVRDGQRLISNVNDSLWGAWDELANDGNYINPMIGFYLTYEMPLFSQSNPKEHILDIYVGQDTTTGHYLLKNLVVNINNSRTTHTIYYPLFVPAGSRIWARMATRFADDGSQRALLGVQILPVYGSVNEMDGCYSKHETVGLVDRSNDRDGGTVSSNPTAINTWGPWFYLGNTNFRWEGWLLSVQPRGATSNSAQSFQVSAGDPTDTNYVELGGESPYLRGPDSIQLQSQYYSSRFTQCNLPAGTPIWVRYATSNAAGTSSDSYVCVEGIG